MTGEALRRRDADARKPLGRTRRPGKAREGRPGSQETCPDRQRLIRPRGKGWPHAHRPVLGLLPAAAVPALPCRPPLAAPVTVDLRVEGPTKTLFEGPVTTDVAPFRFSDRRHAARLRRDRRDRRPERHAGR